MKRFRKRIICIILVIIAAIGSGIGIYIISEANKAPATIEDSEALFKTTLKELPTDGSLPTDHTTLDNAAYALWKIQNTDSFMSTTTGTSEASVATIQIYNSRVVIGDTAMVSTISSGLVSSGKQKYFTDGKVLLRDADSINGFNSSWKSETPEVLSNKGYISRYGWLPFECSGYIVCEDTVLESSDVIQNEDGTYSFSLLLNPNRDYAPFWYRREVLTNASSTIEPVFYSIRIEYKIDSNWTILESRIQEEYKVKSMGIEAVSKTNCVETFEYENVSFNDDYVNYFNGYNDLVPEDGVDTPIIEDDALTMITSSLQNPDKTDKTLSLSAKINDNTITGLVSLNISDLTNVKVKAKLDNPDLYIEYSDNLYLSIGGLKVKSSMSDLSKLLGLIDLGSSSSSLDTAKIISDINSGSIVKNEDGTLITLTTTLDLMGISLPLTFNFSYIDGVYTLLDAKTSLSVDDTSIELQISESSSTIEEVSKDEYQDINNLDFIIDFINEVLTSKKIAIDLDLTYSDLVVNANGKIDFNSNIKLDLDLTITYKTLSESINLKYLNDTLYLNYNDINLKITVDDLIKMIAKYSGNEETISLDTTLDINSIVSILLSLDYSSIIKDLELNENELNTTIGLGSFLEGMSDIQLSITNNEGLDITAIVDKLNLSINLASTYEEEIIVNDELYSNLGYIEFLIDDVLAIYNEKKIVLDIVAKYESLNIAIIAKADFTSSLALDATITLSNDKSSQSINIVYLENTIYLTLDNIKLKTTINDLMELLSSLGVDLNTSEETNVSLDSILDTLLTLDYSTLLKGLSLKEDNIELTLGLSSVLENLNDLTININNKDNGFGFKLNLLDISGSVSVDNTLEITVGDDYISLETIFEDIEFLVSLIGKESFNINVDGTINLNVNGELMPVEMILDLDLILTNDKYNLVGIITLSVLDITLNLNIKYIDGYIYFDLYDDTIKLPLSALISNISPLINTSSSSESINLESLDLGIIKQISDLIIFKDEDSIDVNLIEYLPILAILSLDLSLKDNSLTLAISNSTNFISLDIDITKTDKNTILVPSEVIEFTTDDINYLFSTIKNLVNNINNNSTFILNIDTDIYGISILGSILITKDLDLSVELILNANSDDKLTLNIYYIDDVLYLSLNGLNVYFTNNDFETIISTVKELLSVYLESNQEETTSSLNINLDEIVSSLLVSVKNKDFNANNLALSLGLNFLGLKDVLINTVITDESIILNGQINKDIIINNISLDFSNDKVSTIDFTNFLAISNVVNLFENLETGVSSSGELSIVVMGYNILLPYEMNFRLDLIELLKGKTVFEAIELELVISSELYEDDIILTIYEGYIYLDSMQTKFKYEIPKYSINGLLGSLSSSEETNSDSTSETNSVDNNNISNIINVVIGYVNDIVIKTSSTGLEISLNENLKNTLNDMIKTMLGTEILINDISIVASNLTATTADFNISASISALGMDVNASLSADTKILEGNKEEISITHLSEEQRNEFILTENFLEHPFATRVQDILKMVKGFASLDYSKPGQRFDFNIGLKMNSSSAVNNLNVEGSIGISLDLQSALNGGDIWESLNLYADVKISASLILTLTINVKAFYVGDGYLYLIVNGGILGSTFSIAKEMIDLQGLLEDALGTNNTAEGEDVLTVVYLNDLINKIISGFTTNTVETLENGNTKSVTTLTLEPAAVRVVATLWRKVADTVNDLVNSLDVGNSIGNSTIRSIIGDIDNFDIDVNGFKIIYTSINDELSSLQIILSGVNHENRNSTSLPITISLSDTKMTDTSFDEYINLSNDSEYKNAREEIYKAKEMVDNLSNFVYTEEYYKQLTDIVTYLDSMSDMAKSSYDGSYVRELKVLYEELKSAEIIINKVLLDEEVSSDDILNSYEAYLYFYNLDIFTIEELEKFEAVYLVTIKEELKNLASDIDLLVELETIDFEVNLEEVLIYRTELDSLLSRYNSLNEYFKEFFIMFYGEQHDKLFVMANSYNTSYELYANSTIDNYISEILVNDNEYIPLANAQELYLNTDFTSIQTYGLNEMSNSVKWSYLDNVIYYAYVRNLDLNIAKAMTNNDQIELFALINEYTNEYEQYSTKFKSLFKNDIESLQTFKADAESVYQARLLEVLSYDYFNIDTKKAKEKNNAATVSITFYLFDSFKLSETAMKLDENNYSLINELLYLNEIGVRAGIDLLESDSFITNNTTRTINKISVYLYKFALMVNDSSVSVEELKDFATVLDDVSKNYYSYYEFKHNSGFLGIGVYDYLSKEEKRSYLQLLANNSDEYTKGIYDKYLERIS